jgi:hypothetical protein
MKKPGQVTILRAADAEAGAAVDAEGTKRQVAKHFLLASDGSVVEDFEKATGCRYTDIATGRSIDYQLVPNSDAMRMWALFGWRTLATNEASAVRNSKDGGGSDEQLAAITERIALIHGTDGNGGVWVDRTREVGARYDLPTLATAAVNVLVREGKLADTDETKSKAYAKFLAGMEADKAKVTTIRQVEGVEQEYKRLQGKTTKTADDLVSMLS